MTMQSTQTITIIKATLNPPKQHKHINIYNGYNKCTAENPTKQNLAKISTFSYVGKDKQTKKRI